MSDKAGSRSPDPATPQAARARQRARYRRLQRLEDWLETPMLILAFAWLVVLVLELIQGEDPLYHLLGAAIWVVFFVDFAVKVVLAVDKAAYIRRNWLTAVSLLVPALRIFRFFRALRLLRLAGTARGFRLIRVIGSLNRGRKALSTSLSRRGFGYVVALTALVTFAGAAAMYAFESDVAGGLEGYGEALWWTAMIMTTMGSQYWPQTVEGRVLCVFLALYAFAVFGYVTAALATFFVGRDADDAESELAGSKQLAALRNEVIALRDEIRALAQRPPESGGVART